MAIPSEEFFNYLYRTYHQALCFFSLKMVANAEAAKDIVEEVFTKLIISKRDFTAVDNVRAWLYTATRNASLDYLKQEKHTKERQFEFSNSNETEEKAYEYEMVRAEVLRKILQEIKQLPGHSGVIIEMSYFQGIKNEEIARVLGLSEKTVRNLKSVGIATLKSKIPLDLFLMFLLLVDITGS